MGESAHGEVGGGEVSAVVRHTILVEESIVFAIIKESIDESVITVGVIHGGLGAVLLQAVWSAAQKVLEVKLNGAVQWTTVEEALAILVRLSESAAELLRGEAQIAEFGLKLAHLGAFRLHDVGVTEDLTVDGLDVDLIVGGKSGWSSGFCDDKTLRELIETELV